MRILQVSTLDMAGGAERIALNLFNEYRRRGHHSWLAVGHKYNDDPDVFLIPNDALYGRWARAWLTIGNIFKPLVGKVRGAGSVRNILHWVGQPKRWLEVQRGHEDFDFPGTRKLLEFPPELPEIVHCHNLHGSILPLGGYFDLRALPWFSQQVPVILTLHDAWLLSGHCAHSFDCERWKIGCGECPDLSIYQAIPRDATAYNWQRKRDIYAKSRLYVATPSRWLMRKVEQSILTSAIIEARVIPNGVDLTIFYPGDRQEARAMLNIPQNAKMLLFVGHGTRNNPWKDYATLEVAVKRVAECLPDERIILVCLGEEQKPERIGRAEVQFIGYQKELGTVARLYQAADIYLHASKADTFPNTVLEALACGTPVVATGVGGIPEQVENGVTGFLVPPGDAEGIAKAIIMLLTDDALRMRLGRNAAKKAQRRFDLERQANEYISWYQEILENWQCKPEA